MSCNSASGMCREPAGLLLWRRSLADRQARRRAPIYQRSWPPRAQDREDDLCISTGVHLRRAGDLLKLTYCFEFVSHALN